MSEHRAPRSLRAGLLLLPATTMLAAVVAGQWLVADFERADHHVVSLLAAEHLRVERLGRELALAAGTAPSPGDDRLARLLEEPAGARRAARAVEPAAEPWNADATRPVAVALAGLDGAWGDYAVHLEEALTALGAAREMAVQVERFQSVAAGILVSADALANELESRDSEREQLHAAARQVLLAQRMRAGARRLLEGGDDALTAADRFGRDVVVFGEVNNALLSGNRQLRIARVEHLDARALLESIGRDFRRATVMVETAMGLVARSAELPGKLAGVARAGERLDVVLDDLRHEHDVSVGSRLVDRRSLRACTSLALAALLLALMALNRGDARAARDARQRGNREASKVAHETNLDAGLEDVRRVLVAWADGAIDTSLRERDALPVELVEALDRAREGVGGVVDELREEIGELEALVGGARGRAARLAGSAGDQAERTEAASRAALDVRTSLEPLSAHLAELAETVRGASGTVHSATAPVRDSLAGVGEMARSVSTTRDRVRRLSEELHALQDLCELLDEISDQAKLLSVNVAIQASMDTESGRALANFSDDVQRLSERARHGLRCMQGARERLQAIAGEALKAIKRGAWSADAAATGGRAADEPLAALEREVAVLEQLQRSLDTAARAHAANVDRSAHSMSGVGALADEVRDGAVALSDTTARLEHLAARALAVAGRLAPVPAADGRVVRIEVPGDAAERTESGDGPRVQAVVVRPFERRE